MLLGFLLGAIVAIIAVIILNKNKVFRMIGIFIAIACIVFLCNHDGVILDTYRAYGYGKAPFMLQLQEGFIELFILIFPIARVFAIFGNVGRFVEQSATDEQRGILNIIRIVLVNLAKIFFR